MGILNVTPDSFSDGGLSFSKSSAISRALEMEEEGADIIDIGGESTRPGALPVPLEEEMARIVPVIMGIRRKSAVPISVDTAKPEVARAAVDAGADAINDVTGFTDPLMVSVAAGCGKPAIVMHMKGTPRTMQKHPRYSDVTAEVKGFLRSQTAMLKKAGVGKMIVDPGIGFGKTVGHNLALLRDIGKIAALGYPVLVGASRKSFIGRITGGDVSGRLPGSIAVHVISLLEGASIIRVHDVTAHRQALEMARLFL